MTKFSKSSTALGVAAIAAAVLGATAISAETANLTREAHAQTAAPVACALNIGTASGLLQVEPVIQATEAVSGIYQLRVEGPGTRMNQGGPFSVRAGQTVELGRMMTSGSASSLDAEFTLTIAGRTYRCPTSL
ncbi:curli-like amyloid fiber formation chaperone CsgH [Jannaschia sp. CCS1]|uniref:curli-like amyloid fiber formation chaperone CsgH n=1 Tax=Jannaschia sp. (strain CCS1) TaxID=290400 RepID=UPI000053AFE9|nr:curli-like amyloid fiber formation chaperone CsgH [Jannaschia sp. CCS1]ABD52924.1 hypothetical protein Jann_0007 [Jannaschia sp. CCS1]